MNKNIIRKSIQAHKKLVKAIEEGRSMNISLIESRYGYETVWNLFVSPNGSAQGRINESGIIRENFIYVESFIPKGSDVISSLHYYLENVLKAKSSFVEAGQIGFHF